MSTKTNGKKNNAINTELEGKTTDELLKEVYKLLKTTQAGKGLPENVVIEVKAVEPKEPSKILGAVSVFGKGIKHGIKTMGRKVAGAAHDTVNSFKAAAAAEDAEASVRKAKKEDKA